MEYKLLFVLAVISLSGIFVCQPVLLTLSKYFPNDPISKEIWINATGRFSWFPTKNSTICSQHFKENDFIIKKSGNRYLKDKAEPSKNILTRISQVIDSQSNAAKTSFTPIASTSQPLVEADIFMRPKITAHIEFDESQKENEPMSTNQELINIVNNDSPKTQKMKQLLELKNSQINRQNLKIKRLQAKNRRFKKNIANLQELLKSIEEKISIQTEHLRNLENTNLSVHELIARQALNEKSGVISRRKYSPALRTFALTLHYYSPKAYDYVRRTFNTSLPHPQTLKKWYSKIGGEPGFTKEAFEAIKLKCLNSEHCIVGALIIDEMAIRRRIEWDGQRLHGYVNIGTGLEGDHLEEAKEALVFLVSAINSSFKVPVGYFLVDGVPGAQRAELVKQCIELLHNSGMRIVALTFDGCAANLAMATKLGCHLENSEIKFVHPVTGSPVVIILDPCHMIKLLRNTLQTYKTIVDQDNNSIEWQFLKELNNVQVIEKFHLTNKLTHHHINFENQRMKVKLATQLFSSSVAEALKFCREDLKMKKFQGSEATEKFILIINDIFDIFNTKNLHQFGFKKAIKENSASLIFDYLNMACIYLYKYKPYLNNQILGLHNLKTENGIPLIKSPRKTGFLGFIGCAAALKLLYNELIVTKMLIYLPFYKLSQDHIELLFGNIRAHGGSNNNPTARQFVAAYKKLLVHVEIKNSDLGNCTALENISILNCTSAVERINKTSGPNLFQEDLNEESIEADIQLTLENISDFSLQVIAYIAGYVVRDLIKNIRCDICVAALTTNESNDFHKFIIAKNKGGLLFPSADTIKICKAAESVVRSVEGTIFKKETLLVKIVKKFIGTNIFENINYHQINEFPTSNHVTDLIKAIAEKYMNVRIHHILKLNKKISKRQVLSKYVLFQGQ